MNNKLCKSGQMTYEEIDSKIKNTDKDYIGFYFIDFDSDRENNITGRNLYHLNESNNRILWITPGYVKLQKKYIKEHEELDITSIPCKTNSSENYYWYFYHELYFQLLNQFDLGQIDGGCIIIFNKKYWSTNYDGKIIKDDIYAIEVNRKNINLSICDKKLYKEQIQDTINEIAKEIKKDKKFKWKNPLKSLKVTFNPVTKEIGFETTFN